MCSHYYLFLRTRSFCRMYLYQLLLIAETVGRCPRFGNIVLFIAVRSCFVSFSNQQFFFKGPHEDANREAHAYNFLLAFVEFLENIYQCIGWPAPKILSWNLHTKATGADRKNAGLVQEYARNGVMKDIVGWVLRKKLEGGRKLQRQLAIKSF